jgi:hypothetical protein
MRLMSINLIHCQFKFCRDLVPRHSRQRLSRTSRLLEFPEVLKRSQPLELQIEACMCRFGPDGGAAGSLIAKTMPMQ